MTLRRKRDRLDDLGRQIHWALQDRVADATPSPQTWERIQARAERETPLARNIRAFLRSVGVWLSADAGLSLGVAGQRDMLGVWHGDLSWMRGRSRSSLTVELAF